MLLAILPDDRPSLSDMIQEAEKYPEATSFGEDIDSVTPVLCSDAPVDDKFKAMMGWIARHQPCLFGRLGAKDAQHIGIDVCWIDEDEVRNGDFYISQKIQAARREWKLRAAEGVAHGFLIMFNGSSLSRVKPGKSLLKICERISELYLIEHTPIRTDVIYTEAVPLRQEGLRLFKGGINIFYPSAHRTRNHDRRIPGGILVSVNSPGHWANSLVKRNCAPDLTQAVDQAMDIALRSIGNGGMGCPHVKSASWHNIETDSKKLASRRYMRGLPRFVPESHSQNTYSALYHTDVLVPTDVTVDDEIDPNLDHVERWEHLVLSYISDKDVPQEHVNYALFHGHPVPEEAIFHNPWPPRAAINSPLSLD